MWLGVCLSVSGYGCVSLCMSLSVCVCVWLCICLSMCLSVSLCICLSDCVSFVGSVYVCVDSTVDLCMTLFLSEGQGLVSLCVSSFLYICVTW